MGFGLAPGIALLLGAGLALSSTAIVSKELTSLGEIFSSHGQNAIGVLLFQDVVAVLLLTLVPVFAGSSDQAWYWALPLTLGKTVVLFVGLAIARGVAEEAGLIGGLLNEYARDVVLAIVVFPLLLALFEQGTTIALRDAMKD